MNIVLKEHWKTILFLMYVLFIVKQKHDITGLLLIMKNWAMCMFHFENERSFMSYNLKYG